MTRTDWMSKAVIVTGAVGAGDLFEARRVQRNAKSQGVIGVGCCQISCRNHEQLIRVRCHRRVYLRAAYNDAVALPVHHADVVVGMLLLGGSAAPVTFDVRLCDCHSQIATAAMFVDGANSGEVVRS